jgi:prepilin-type N-terminal cleavage/methylation domain-containing protein
MNKKGVTLIELVIVMVIIAIGAVLAAPNIGGFLPHYRLRSATRDIVSTMRTAQMKAVSTNMEHRVSFTIGNPGSYILQRNSAGWVDDGARQTLPTGVGITFSTSNFEFNPDSTSSSANLTLTNSKNSTKKIVLSSMGRIRVE